MKSAITLLIVGVLACSSIYAQDADTNSCKELIKILQDKMTGDITFYAPIWITDNNDENIITIIILLIVVTPDETDKEIKSLEMNIRIHESIGCIPQDSKVIFLFRDDKRYNAKNTEKFNCNGETNIRFGGYFSETGDLLKALRTEQIEAMRIYTVRDHIDVELAESQSENIRMLIDCFTDLMDFKNKEELLNYFEEE